MPFLDAYTKAIGNNEYYENVLRIISFLNSHDLKALPITNEKWYEMDDKQDLDIVDALFADEKDVHAWNIVARQSYIVARSRRGYIGQG